MLQDQNTYTIVKKNLNNMLKKWLQKGFISRYTYFSLFSNDSILLKAYGLPKIHKNKSSLQNHSFIINTALYTLASFLQKIISTSLTYDDKHVKKF